jgi:hypothetical protein
VLDALTVGHGLLAAALATVKAKSMSCHLVYVSDLLSDSFNPAEENDQEFLESARPPAPSPRPC